MSEINERNVDAQQAAATAEAIKASAEKLEAAIADMEAGIAQVEGRSNAGFIQDLKAVVTQFKESGVAEAAAAAKTAAIQTKTVADLQAAEAQRNIEI